MPRESVAGDGLGVNLGEGDVWTIKRTMHMICEDSLWYMMGDCVRMENGVKLERLQIWEDWSLNCNEISWILA